MDAWARRLTGEPRRGLMVHASRPVPTVEKYRIECSMVPRSIGTPGR